MPHYLLEPPALWWILGAIGAVLLVHLLWRWREVIVGKLPLLLQQILFPPIIDAGHHTTKRWHTVRDTRLKHSSGRCCICGALGEKTWHLFSIRRRGWRWEVIAARSTSRKPPVHEVLYSWVRKSGQPPKRWLWVMCPTHHAALHAFDKWLFGWWTNGEPRNRFLWLSSLLYRFGWYVAYSVPLLALAVGALWWWQPELVHPYVSQLMTKLTP